MKRTTAVGYIRVSTEKQDLSPEAQRDVLVRWASHNDIRLLSIHSDVCSGATPWLERPGLLEAVNVLKREGASWLVTAKADRLSRDLFNMLHLQRELETVDARPISCTEEPTETTTPESELMRQMLASFAQFERQLIRGRIKAALQVRKNAGVKLGAQPLEDTELGRCIVWAIWTMRDRGMGPKAITAELNARGVVGPRGGQQHFRNVQRVLRRPRPVEKPRSWQGMGYRTWKQFDVQYKRRSNSSRGNRTDSNKTGGFETSESVTSSDRTPAEQRA